MSTTVKEIDSVAEALCVSVVKSFGTVILAGAAPNPAALHTFSDHASLTMKLGWSSEYALHSACLQDLDAA